MPHSADSGNAGNTGTVHLVATPIGNLSDITVRAVKTLQEVDFIAAEDTRVTRKLLSHLNIKKPLISYHAHNRHTIGEKILARVLAGESLAVVTDAGTPGISDPGEDIVRLCCDADIPVIAIPGACAAVAALTLSGLPTSRFVFEGFLPSVKGKRLERLRLLSPETRTMVFYEAPHRLLRTLGDMLDVFGDRRVSISRELTKIYEQTLRFTLREAIANFKETAPRGEFVIVLDGRGDAPSPAGELENAVKIATRLIDSGMPKSSAAKEAARETGCPKNEIYKLVIPKKLQ